MSKAKISVIIPLFNKEKSIYRCLYSVYMQTTLPDEVIVVNDGSTDNGLKVAKTAIEELNLPCRIIDKENAGVSSARNLGSSIAKNDYIAFLDADDEWFENHIQLATRMINQFPNADLISFSHILSRNGGKPVKPKHGLPSEYCGYVDEFFKVSKKGSVVNSSKAIVRKNALIKIGGFPEKAKLCEDIYVWIMLALHGQVAFHGAVTCKINQDMDLSRESRSNKVPYPIIFFSQSTSRHLLTKDLYSYLWSLHVRHVAMSLKNHKKAEAMNRLLSGCRVFPIRGRLVYILYIFPPLAYKKMHSSRNKIQSIKSFITFK